MNQTSDITGADCDAEVPPGAKVRALFVHEHALIRDMLAFLLKQDDGLELLGAVDSQSARRDCVGTPDVVLMAYGSESSIAEDVERVQREFPNARILLLDDIPNDGRVLLALRTNVRGYLTTRQTGADLLSAIRKTAVGDRVFTPEIAARLSFTQEGIRLQRPTGEGPLASLTPREREVMTYLSLGYTVKQTASALGLRPSTVDNHKTRLMKKLKVHKTVELTRLAFRYGLVASEGARSLPQIVEVDGHAAIDSNSR